ncbi:MAG: putative transport system ATP-binding protein [Acetobacterium sp.]|nr:putative transport system ATP-binding protein [Acetobacterium sp.]
MAFMGSIRYTVSMKKKIAGGEPPALIKEGLEKMKHFIEFKDVHKRYHMGEVTINAANGIDFFIDEGEFAVVVGPSGAGKTTVLNILGGMDNCDEGQVIVGEKDVATLNRRELAEYRRYDTGFVFQFYNLIQNLTAVENVELATQICHDPMDAETVLKSVGLEERLGNFPSQLSGGEQQRVAIARALAKRPKLLLCDEPTGALDYNTGKNILKLLQETSRKENMTVILITHNQAITPMADKVIIMKNGQVQKSYLNEKPLSVDEIEW